MAMVSGRRTGRFGNGKRHLLAVVLVLSLAGSAVWAQVTASITGTVRDTSGAVVAQATVSIKHLETGLTRTVQSDSNGSYTVPSLPVGQYEVSAGSSGFKQQVRGGINLAVGQQAVVNLILEVGNVEQQITVMAEAPLVNTTLSSTAGLVGEKEVKDLPLNGRSFDQLLTLNVGIINYSSNIGHVGNVFSVVGRKPEENRFLINGVEYVGTTVSGDQLTPVGASGQLLGVDAVREFNVVQHTYGAAYGKRAGGQVSTVTSSGTNQLHGTAFEYLRNSALDARNFFDYSPGLRIPPFKRNQFGGALGGPLKKDKLFLFGNYEGFRQRLGISDVAIVPDALARQGYLPIGPNNSEILVPNLKPGMLPYANYFWPAPNGPNLGGGIAYNYSNPLQKVGEDFGVVRFDYNVSAKDSLSVNYLVDTGENDPPDPDPIFVALNPQTGQVLGIQETHVFSPTLLNVATLGYSRATAASGAFPIVPIPSNLAFIKGNPGLGIISIGGSAIGVGVGSVTGARSFASVGTARNYFSWADDVHFIKGNHSLNAGLWFQLGQEDVGASNSTISGTIAYPTLLAFLQDAPTSFNAIPNPTWLGYRTREAAWYVEDEIKLKPNLTVRLGLRDEMTNGWNEAHDRCANYTFDSSGVIQTNPFVGHSCLTQNNAAALWQPRVGLAWDPTGTGTWAVRAGFGIYNNLQDNLGFRMASNPPFNAKLTLTTPLLSFIPIRGGTQPPPSCSPTQGQPCSLFSPSGVEPNLHTPTIQEWSFTVERQITSNLALQLGYVGSQAYHAQTTVDANVPFPRVCSDPQGCTSGGTLGAAGHVPQGATYVPPGPRANPYVGSTQTYFYNGVSSYHALNASLVKRASHGLVFKANYTFSKALDMMSGVNTINKLNEPSDVLNPFNLALNKGLAAYNLKHQFNANFSYELPFGNNQQWGSGASGFVEKLIGGWQWNGILTAESGFPFTPQVGSNRSGMGDVNNPDVPNRNPAFSGPVILGKPGQWYNPQAFVLPTPGTFGNVSRGAFIGPGLMTLDTSLFKRISINERWSLQFRAEGFNILNRANFGTPTLQVFSGTNVNPAAGGITKTAITSRQIQFALKLIF